jgi:hypothetical protein
VVAGCGGVVSQCSWCGAPAGSDESTNTPTNNSWQHIHAYHAYHECQGVCRVPSCGADVLRGHDATLLSPLDSGAAKTNAAVRRGQYIPFLLLMSFVSLCRQLYCSPLLEARPGDAAASKPPPRAKARTGRQVRRPSRRAMCLSSSKRMHRIKIAASESVVVWRWERGVGDEPHLPASISLAQSAQATTPAGDAPRKSARNGVRYAAAVQDFCLGAFVQQKLA